jgi:CTP:molybdopterin cytidylyltransferase MocA
MMPIGDLTIAQRVVINFQEAGIKEIVVVTGYRSRQLRDSLEDFDITFVENNDYEHTDMFASAMLGLKRFMKGYDRVLFCPVDIPFFMRETVEALLECSAPIVIPRCSGRKGHPISISSNLLPAILTYKGNRGLKGAIESCKAEIAYVDVNDPGILMDADTREDYERLVGFFMKKSI